MTPAAMLLGGDEPQIPMTPADAMREQQVDIEIQMEATTSTAKKMLPPEYDSEDKRKVLSQHVRAAVEASAKLKKPLEKRWKVIDAMWRNEMVPERLPYNGAAAYPVNVVKPRITKRAALIVSTLTGGDTFFEFKKVGDQTASDEMNQLFEWFMEVTRHDTWIRHWVRDCLKYGVSHLRVQYVQGKVQHKATIAGPYTGPEFHVIPPCDFHIWPATAEGISAAKYVGHTFQLLESEVKAKQKAGEFLEGNFVSGKQNTKGTRTASIRQDTEAGYGESLLDNPVKFHDGLYVSFESGTRQVFRVVTEIESSYVALVHKYELDEFWYIAMHSETETDVHWPSGSPGHDQQSPQRVITQLVNEMLWGIAASARRAHGITNMSGQELANYKDNELIPLPADAQVLPLGGDFNPQGYDVLIQLFMSLADSVGSTSDTITGAPSASGSRTATEQNIKFQGFQLGGEDDVRAMSDGLISLGKLLLHMAKAYWYLSAKEYPDAFTLKDESVLNASWIIELANMSPEDSPSMQGQQAQALATVIGSIGQLVPAAQIIILPLLKIIIRGTSLPNAAEMIQQIEEYERAQQADEQQIKEQEDIIAQYLADTQMTPDQILAEIAQKGGGAPQPQPQPQPQPEQ